MGPTVFITGASGYIGGEVLHAIASSNPDYDIAALVRNSDKGALVAAAFPKLRLVYGTLDDADILEEESKKADIVVNCADADHPGAVSAIVSGLAPHKGYLIHTSGTGLLLYSDMAAKIAPGTKLSDHIYDDWSGVEAVVSMPPDAPHRNVDILALDSHTLGAKVTVVAPPAIYGESRSPTGAVSTQVPALARATLKNKSGVMVNQGLAWWNHVHIQDLGLLYSALVEAAATNSSRFQWGPQNYYFAESGEHIWKDVSKLVAKEAKKQGLIVTDEVVSVTPEQLDKLEPSPPASMLLGHNSRGKAVRAREIFGWKPTGPKLDETIGETVKKEALKLGMKAGHAAKVSGE